MSHPPTSYGIWFFWDCAPPKVSLWLLLCLQMWGIFFGEFQCLAVNDCPAASCDCGVLARGSESSSFYSAILVPPLPSPFWSSNLCHWKRVKMKVHRAYPTPNWSLKYSSIQLSLAKIHWTRVWVKTHKQEQIFAVWSHCDCGSSLLHSTITEKNLICWVNFFFQLLEH